MAQKPNHDRPPLRAVSTGSGTGADGEETVGASVQQIWELVRKSTDVIVALREENGILRNELASLRKSEQQLQDRLQDFLERIDVLERQHRTEAPKGRDTSGQQIDRLEDSLVRAPIDTTDDEVKITITVKDSRKAPRTGTEIDEAVRDIIDAAATAIKSRVSGA